MKSTHIAVSALTAAGSRSATIPSTSTFRLSGIESVKPLSATATCTLAVACWAT